MNSNSNSPFTNPQNPFGNSSTFGAQNNNKPLNSLSSTIFGSKSTSAFGNNSNQNAGAKFGSTGSAQNPFLSNNSQSTGGFLANNSNKGFGNSNPFTSASLNSGSAVNPFGGQVTSSNSKFGFGSNNKPFGENLQQNNNNSNNNSSKFGFGQQQNDKPAWLANRQNLKNEDQISFQKPQNLLGSKPAEQTKNPFLASTSEKSSTFGLNPDAKPFQPNQRTFSNNRSEKSNSSAFVSNSQKQPQNPFLSPRTYKSDNNSTIDSELPSRSIKNSPLTRTITNSKSNLDVSPLENNKPKVLSSGLKVGAKNVIQDLDTEENEDEEDAEDEEGEWTGDEEEDDGGDDHYQNQEDYDDDNEYYEEEDGEYFDENGRDPDENSEEDRANYQANLKKPDVRALLSRKKSTHDQTQTPQISSPILSRKIIGSVLIANDAKNRQYKHYYEGDVIPEEHLKQIEIQKIKDLANKPIQKNLQTTSSQKQFDHRPFVKEIDDDIRAKPAKQMPSYLNNNRKNTSDSNISVRTKPKTDFLKNLIRTEAPQSSLQKSSEPFKKNHNTTDSDQYEEIYQETNKYQNLTMDQKCYLLEERDNNMRNSIKKQMEKLGENSTQNLQKVKPTCPDMCPEYERYFRAERSNQISHYESGPDGLIDHSKCVKDYERGAADANITLPHQLRPLSVLEHTINFLCITTMNSELPTADFYAENSLNRNTNLADWYEFNWSRLRAIRRDLTELRALEDPRALKIIQICCRFHLYCDYCLCNEGDNVWNKKLNDEHIDKCLISLKQAGSEGFTEEFVVYDILLNFDDPLQVAYSLTKVDEGVLRSSPKIEFARKLYQAYLCGNYAFWVVGNFLWNWFILLFRFYEKFRSHPGNRIQDPKLDNLKSSLLKIFN